MTASQDKSESVHYDADPLQLIKPRREIEFGDPVLLGHLLDQMRAPYVQLQKIVERSIEVISASVAYTYVCLSSSCQRGYLHIHHPVRVANQVVACIKATFRCSSAERHSGRGTRYMCRNAENGDRAIRRQRPNLPGGHRRMGRDSKRARYHATRGDLPRFFVLPQHAASSVSSFPWTSCMSPY